MELVKVTINGREYEAPKGKLLIEVCKDNQIEIPSFCYYPHLTPQAACRMCLVRIEKMPKLQTSCTITVADGMIVTTDSPEIIEMRKGMLDFILGNHPLDCPVCDKGGQCELQDMAFQHGTVYADYLVSKNNKEERRLSPFIAYDEQRCVKCYRCVRVCEEWMDVHALTKIFRGTNEIIGFYGNDLHCEQCGNCVEVCPVGALLSVDSRFKSRPWDMKETVTTCTYCADGCQLNLGIRSENYVRAASKDLTGINGEFLCIKGRYGSAFISSPERLKTPLIRKDGQLVETSWDEAIKYTANQLKQLRHTYEGKSIGLIGSPRINNEANFSLFRFGKALQTPYIAHFRQMELGTFYKYLAAPIATHEEVKNAKNILLIGGDPTEENPFTGFSIRHAQRKNDAKILVVNHQPIKIARRQSDQFLHIRPNSESAIIQALVDQSNINKLAELAGVSPEELSTLCQKIHNENDWIIIFGSQVTGPALVVLACLTRFLGTNKKIKYLPLVQYNNSVGVFDMGLTKNADELSELCGKSIKALYIVGSDPINQYGKRWENTIKNLDFLAVNELFLTDTAKQANVVFPAASYAEQDGTFTNIAGQVQKVTRALEGKGQVRPDWLIIQAIAKEMLLNMSFSGSAGSLFKNISYEIPEYEGLSFAKLKEAGGTIKTRRNLAQEIHLASILQELHTQTSIIDTTVPHLTTIPAMGNGLFKMGNLLNQVPVMNDAQPFWEAERLEEE